mmetsp:Transcript_82001/g.206316  ORF Transcript_82001/g.206316 Transcript_82001/m.206316 type:complete len:120 (+) Transcript_82001:1171-1530(+)
MVHKINKFELLAKPCKSRVTSNAAVLSKALVGSSNTKIDGLFTKASAMQRRFFWPPDSPLRNKSPTRVCSHDFNPVWSSTSSTRASRSLAEEPAPCKSAPYLSVSRVVSWLQSSGSCAT